MALEILLSLRCGSASFEQDRIIYDLEVGSIVPGDFFSPTEKEKYLKKGLIKESSLPPSTFPKGEKIRPLPALGKMKLIEAKEFLEDEYDVTKLEKYYDQENDRKLPRKKLLEWIQKKVFDLQGFETARTK